MTDLTASAAIQGPRSQSKRRGLLRSLQSAIGLVVIFILALIVGPRSSSGGLVFLESGNITDVLRQVSEIGVIALGMTLVILTAGIDLSVGSILALSSVYCGGGFDPLGRDKPLGHCLGDYGCGGSFPADWTSERGRDRPLADSAFHRNPGRDDWGSGTGPLAHVQHQY